MNTDSEVAEGSLHQPRIAVANRLGGVLDQPDHRLVRQPGGGHNAAGTQADEQGIIGVAGGPVLQPAAQGSGSAQIRVVGAPNRDRRAGAVLRAARRVSGKQR